MVAKAVKVLDRIIDSTHTHATVGFVPDSRNYDWATAIASPDAPLDEWDEQLTEAIQTLSRIRKAVRGAQIKRDRG